MTLEFQKWLAVGAGVGIRIEGDDLAVTVVRIRPGGVRVLATTTITDFRHRPAGVWGAEYGQEAEYLRVYIGRLRSKIEDDPAAPRYIITERGVGYSFAGG